MFFATLTVLFIFYPGVASAYIEPGTGLMITQMLIGSIAGGLVTVKIYWRKLKAKFGPQTGTNSE